MTTVAITSGTVAVVVVVFLLDLFAVLLAMSFLRREQEAAGEGAAVVRPAEEAAKPAGAKTTKVVTRREFFRRSWLASLGLFAAEFGLATIAFLWPNLKGGFGATFTVGTVDEILGAIEETNQPYYFGAGRFYIVPYDGSGKDEATGTDYPSQRVETDGLMPLYQRCVHLGCRVPFCLQSQWFECPCHGSKYNRAGEYQLGPAPRGMDRFKIAIEGDQVTVDTSEIVQGPPRGTNTIHQNPEGPFCA